jgi:hypothetical protein
MIVWERYEEVVYGGSHYPSYLLLHVVLVAPTAGDRGEGQDGEKEDDKEQQEEEEGAASCT